MTAPAAAQINAPDAYERFRSISDWDGLCAIEDCNQFPIGYHTYAFGPEVYYFPTFSTMTVKPRSVFAGGVRAGRLYEPNDDGNPLRSISIAPTSISYCCHHLLTFYGLAESVPIFMESPSGNRMPATRMTLSSFDYPGRYNNIQRWINNDLAAFPRLDEVISKDHLSYNDDFWILDVGDVNGEGFRPFRLL